MTKHRLRDQDQNTINSARVMLCWLGIWDIRDQNTKLWTLQSTRSYRDLAAWQYAGWQIHSRIKQSYPESLVSMISRSRDLTARVYPCSAPGCDDLVIVSLILNDSWIDIVVVLARCRHQCKNSQCSAFTANKYHLRILGSRGLIFTRYANGRHFGSHTKSSLSA